MELWDVYDEHYIKTGKTVRRGIDELKEGEYHLAVHIWIINNKGEFLIQKRSANKKHSPGMWAMTGGAVIAGEDTRDGCLRETEEEIGIVLRMEYSYMIRRKKKEKEFLDIWLIKEDIDIKDMKLQEEEVTEVKWVKPEEIYRLYKNGEFAESAYESFIMCMNYIKISGIE